MKRITRIFGMLRAIGFFVDKLGSRLSQGQVGTTANILYPRAFYFKRRAPRSYALILTASTFLSGSRTSTMFSCSVEKN